MEFKRQDALTSRDFGSRKVVPGTAIALSALQAKNDGVQVEVSTFSSRATDLHKEWKLTEPNEEVGDHIP